MSKKTLPPSVRSKPERVSTRRAFEDILLQLEQSLTSNDLAAGDRLPPERELAATFNVSRASVREALRVLEALGLVRVRRGADNGAVFLERPNNALEPLFRFHLALEHASVENLIEFRTVIETWTVQAAAELRQPGPLADAEAAFAGMKEGGRGRKHSSRSTSNSISRSREPPRTRSQSSCSRAAGWLSSARCSRRSAAPRAGRRCGAGSFANTARSSRRFAPARG